MAPAISTAVSTAVSTDSSTARSISSATPSATLKNVKLRRRALPRAAAAADELDAHSGDRSFVMSFARGMSVLQAFAQFARPMTLIEISRRVHIPRTAVRRLLYTLCELGYVRAVDSRYVLTPRSLELGTAFTNSSDFVLQAQPIVARLSERLQTFCALSVPQSGQSMLTCVAGSADIAGPRHRAPGPGSKAPLYASASGLVFLSTFSATELDDYFARTVMLPATMRTPTTPQQTLDLLHDVRAKGYAACDRTLANSVYSVAVPVRDANSRVVGSMLAGIAIDRLPDAGLKTMLVPALTAAAREAGLHWD